MTTRIAPQAVAACLPLAVTVGPWCWARRGSRARAPAIADLGGRGRVIGCPVGERPRAGLDAAWTRASRSCRRAGRREPEPRSLAPVERHVPRPSPFARFSREPAGRGPARSEPRVTLPCRCDDPAARRRCSRAVSRSRAAGPVAGEDRPRPNRRRAARRHRSGSRRAQVTSRSRRPTLSPGGSFACAPSTATSRWACRAPADARVLALTLNGDDPVRSAAERACRLRTDGSGEGRDRQGRAADLPGRGPRRHLDYCAGAPLTGASLRRPANIRPFPALIVRQPR